ncbi:MAG: LysR family transcriptional regulator [Brevirhabdus sp.]
MPNWDDTRVFIAVARAESLSGAGKVLHMDPATVGRRIHRLEEDMQSALFVKSPQGYNLTEAGQRLLEHAMKAEQALLAAEDAVRGSAETLRGTVRIGAPDGCANFLLPQVCAQISAKHPDLDLQVVALPRVFNLSKREADIAIAVSPPQSGRLTVQKITDYKLYLAAMPAYLRQNTPIERVEDLKDHRIIGYIQDMIFSPELDYHDEVQLPRPHLASNSVSVQFNMIRQGAGMGIVHAFAMPAVGRMQKVLPDKIELTRAFYLVRHADDSKVLRLNRVADLLSQLLRDEVRRLESPDLT